MRIKKITQNTRDFNITDAVTDGGTDLNKETFNGMQDNIEKAIDESGKSKTIKKVVNVPINIGDMSITGVGFKPSKITAFMIVNNTIYNSNGFVDENKNAHCIYQYASEIKRNYEGALVVYSNYSAWANTASLKSFDDDGFTLTWGKISSPPSGEIVMIFLCEK